MQFDPRIMTKTNHLSHYSTKGHFFIPYAYIVEGVYTHIYGYYCLHNKLLWLFCNGKAVNEY